ncbi:MAG TPA: glycosyltransferase family 2 protein, partial [Chloroflexota bacterium]|nr:glycosyltransferase family 2 protein [Chloroflexota bacterium]
PVSVVIPAYNEEGAVRAQVESIREVLTAHDLTHEIIVVDDGSTDRTAAEALAAGARVLQHQQNRGYGSSLKTGIKSALYDTIVITDADGTYPPEVIPGLVARLQTADMVVGARVGQNVHIPLMRRPGKWILGLFAMHVAGRQIPDLNSGLRAFRRDCARQYFPILSNRFSFTTTITLAYFADDYWVVYQPINYYKRVGQSKITPRHFMDFLVLVVRMAMLFQPLKVFAPLAFACGALGALKVVYDVASFSLRTGNFNWSLLYQPVLSTSAILLLLVGLQLLLIGMLADGILRRIALQNGPIVESHAVKTLEVSRSSPMETEAAVPANHQ